MKTKQDEDRNISREFGARIYKHLITLCRAFSKEGGREGKPNKQQIMLAIAKLHESALVFFGEEFACLIESRRVERSRMCRAKGKKAERPAIKEVALAVLRLEDSLALMMGDGFSDARASRQLYHMRQVAGICTACGREAAQHDSEQCGKCAK